MAARYPGWYRRMWPEWATKVYDFPANPRKDDAYTAFDGSEWQFNVHGGGLWDCMGYATICMCCGEAIDKPSDEFCLTCLAFDCQPRVREIARESS